MPLKFTIEGPHCPGCKALIQDIMEDLEVPITSLTIDEEARTATLVVEKGDPEQIVAEIKAETEYEVHHA